jgi:methylmalonyl-CoA mutase N-terminal domain/subunit
MLRASLSPRRKGDIYWKRKLSEIGLRKKHRSKLYSARALAQFKRAANQWQGKLYASWVAKAPERRPLFESSSGFALKPIYMPPDTPDLDYSSQGFPGDFPFLRGVYPNMYRGKFWTMRMFSGYGTPEDTNRRLKYLLSHGETGLSIAFDMPTLYGLDADHARAEGEVGRCGVSVSSLKDMEAIFDSVPLDKVSTSMTINAPAATIMCMYMAVAQNQGVPLSKLRGTVQTDILKEFIAQKEWVYPPEAHLRIIRDMLVYCARKMPLWHPISISGYHIREAGSSALQELAFTLADGFAYVELGVEAGLKVDEFAPRLSFFFNCTMDFFEEIAKFRAARRIWATVLKERYGAKKDRSLLMRFHTQTSGASLTWQQPYNNIVRTAIEALAAVLGGTQSLHTNSFDEAYALPTEEAVTVALRTQQIIAEETGVADVIDPLGGSYYLEWLTDKMEEGAYKYFEKIDGVGGVLEAIRSGYIQREIADTAYKFQQDLESGERGIVGVNKFVVKEESPIRTLKIDEKAQRNQVERLRKLRSDRDRVTVERSLAALRRSFENDSSNCIEPILAAVRAYCTLGEITEVGRQVFGEWKEPPIL